jgi:hypothetical protein
VVRGYGFRARDFVASRNDSNSARPSAARFSVPKPNA